MKVLDEYYHIHGNTEFSFPQLKHESSRSLDPYQTRTPLFVHTVNFFPLGHKGKVYYKDKYLFNKAARLNLMIFLKTVVGFAHLLSKEKWGDVLYQ